MKTTFSLVKGNSTCRTNDVRRVKELRELGWVVKPSTLGELL